MQKWIDGENGRNYLEIDGIRIIFENGEIVGWYNPSLDKVV